MSETITLKYPLTDGGTPLESIVIRRPKVRDMLASGKTEGGDAEKEVRLFSGLTDLTPALIESMDLVDYQEMQKVYQGFLD